MADASLTHGVWLERVPELVAECADEWALTPGEPYQAGAAGYTVRADLADGTPAVLKLIYPHRESEHEADALELWDGEGAVRLLARDDERWAMLLERCEPGTNLAEAGRDAALEVLIGLLPRLWQAAGDPFHSLADEAAWWVDYLPGQWEQSGCAVDRRLVDAAVDALRTLPQSQGDQVLLHQDLHGDNVLSAQRESWLVIDPKPLVGEREFALAPIVRSFELGHSKRDVLYRLDRLTSELGLDRERARGWTIGQTMAWAFDSSYIPTHIETVQWLVEAA
ncbi:aminoglycoside phosphotransferase family protein [soil metagenome]